MNLWQWMWQKAALFALRRCPLPQDVIRRSFRLFGSRPALVSAEGELTFDQLADRVHRWCGLLSQWGVGPHRPVFLQLKDTVDFVEVDLALYLMGAMTTLFHEATPPAFAANAARLVQPVLFLHGPQSSPTAEELGRLSPVRCVCLDAKVRASLETTPPLDPRPRLRPDDYCAMGFTSGTSGTPKCLSLVQGAPVRGLRLLIPHLRMTPVFPGTLLSGIPLIGAGSGLIFPWLATGARLALPPAHDKESLFTAIRDFKVTRLFLTPSQLIDILDAPPEETEFMGRMVQVIYGTAPMPAAKLEEAVQRFGPIFQQGYGMAEALPPITFLSMEEHVREGRPAPRSVLSSVGRVVKGVDVLVREDGGGGVETGNPGIVWVKSPTMFSGYRDRPDLNARVLVNGYLRTGDYGFFDSEGYLHILDREQDVMEREGRRLFPRWVEETAHDHPAVKEAAFVVNKRNGRHTLVVSIRRTFRDRPRAPLARDILDFVHRRLDSWMRPDQVRTVEELPRSILGKMLRRDVREFLAHNVEEAL